MMSDYKELRLGFETAYIDGSVASSSIYRPQFVSNNYKEGKKVLSSVEDELLACDRFQISVAFITMSGIMMYHPDSLTKYFEKIVREIDYGHWFFGHYHENRNYAGNSILLYEQIIRIV